MKANSFPITTKDISFFIDEKKLLLLNKRIDEINEKIDCIIVDPPRKGLDSKTKDFLKAQNAKTIIYISCDPMTLARDLKELENDYEIQEFNIMDMFSYTYHIESMVVLKSKCR